MQPQTNKPAIPKTVWSLGFVSLFMDVSSEMVHSLLPLLLVSTLGTSVLTVGIIEGIAEATALIVKLFSGVISDFFQRRKTLLLLGYGLAALTKPLFPLAGSATTVFAARFIDRIGKGIRGAPRDALIADVAPPEIRGACFGLRQSMDTVGAFLGPGMAILLMLVFNDHIQTVLWFAVIPAAISVWLIVAEVKEPALSHKEKHRLPLSRRELVRLPGAFWWVVLVGAVFTLARFSEAFLVLRTQESGVPEAWVPGIMVVMSIFYALSAYPAGWLSDRIDRQRLLAIGLVLLIVADVILALAGNLLWIVLGAAVWGLHMGFSQGILATMVADTIPGDLKGTAFGLFNLISGLCMLLASVVAGGLWSLYGSQATFLTGAVFAAASLALLGWNPRSQSWGCRQDQS